MRNEIERTLLGEDRVVAAEHLVADEPFFGSLKEADTPPPMPVPHPPPPPPMPTPEPPPAPAPVPPPMSGPTPEPAPVPVPVPVPDPVPAPAPPVQKPTPPVAGPTPPLPPTPPTSPAPPTAPGPVETQPGTPEAGGPIGGAITPADHPTVALPIPPKAGDSAEPAGYWDVDVEVDPDRLNQFTMAISSARFGLSAVQDKVEQMQGADYDTPPLGTSPVGQQLATKFGDRLTNLREMLTEAMKVMDQFIESAEKVRDSYRAVEDDNLSAMNQAKRAGD